MRSTWHRTAAHALCLGALILAGAGCEVRGHANVDVVDEHGYHHQGYYDDHHDWHGGYYDADRHFHDDPHDWHHD